MSNGPVRTILLLGMLVLTGCRSEWPGFGGDAENAREPSPVAAAMTPDAERAAARDISRPSDQVAGDGTRYFLPGAEKDEILLLQVKFDVLRTRGPGGLFSGHGPIWNHLDEDAIPVETRVHLNRNGLRAARGRHQSWPPIKAILDHDAEVTTSRTNMSVSNGLPLVIEVHPAPSDQVLFMYRPDGTGAGFTYPHSRIFLRVEYHVPYSDPDAVLVTVMPELRLPQDPDTIEITPETWHLPRSHTLVRVFRELAFEIKIAEDEFFTIGPSANARDNKHLPGALLLCDESEDRTYESMFFITPTVLRSGRTLRP